MSFLSKVKKKTQANFKIILELLKMVQILEKKSRTKLPTFNWCVKRLLSTTFAKQAWLRNITIL